MKTRCFVAILAAFLLASCSSSVEGLDPTDSGSNVPIVTGIRVIAETGQIMGNWRNPTDGPNDDGSVKMSRGLVALFPNPGTSKCPIMYLLERPATVRLWVAAARASAELSSAMESLIGVPPAAPPTLTVVRTLDSGTVRPAGQFTVEWDVTDNAGHRVPKGFYRIFLSIDNTTYWRDKLIVDTDEELRKIFLSRRD
jgi:hypothetical protein